MRRDENFIGQPIHSLQTMLRTLAVCNKQYEPVVPDGVFGNETAKAVSKYQKIHGLSPTGVVDQQTWDEIVMEYDTACDEIEPANSIEIVLNPGEIINKGQYHPSVLLAQAMLNLYADVYEAFLAPNITGIIDSLTQQSIEAFQMLSGLPMTGTMDKSTWKHLTSHFPTACSKKTGCFKNKNK